MKNGVMALWSRGALLVLAVIVTEVVLAYSLPKNGNSYFQGFKIKIEMLAHTASPRILIVGGSGAALGIDSKLISTALCMNVVNTSLHAGLGLAFMLDSVEPYVRNGDWIVLIPEYHLFVAHQWRGDAHLGELALEDPGSVRYMGWEHVITLCETLPVAVQERFRACLNLRMTPDFSYQPVYRSTTFDDYGDVVGHLGLPKQNSDMRLHFDKVPSRLDIMSFWRLGQFINACKKKSANVCILPPAIGRKDYDDVSHEMCDRIYSEIGTRIKGACVLSSPGRYTFDEDSSFFDTIYHLNAKGRQVRTVMLVEDLRPIIQPALSSVQQ